MSDESIKEPHNPSPNATPDAPEASGMSTSGNQEPPPVELQRVTLAPLGDDGDTPEPDKVESGKLADPVATPARVPETLSDNTAPTVEQPETTIPEQIAEGSESEHEAAPGVAERPRSSQRISPPPAESAAERPKRSVPVFDKPVKPRKETYPLVTIVSTLRALIVTFAASVIVATIFMWWTSPEFLSAQTRRELAPVQATAERINSQPTALPTPFWFNRIGIVAGHSGIATYGRTKGNVDPGTVCPDGFNEAGVVMKVAQQAKALLEGRGFTVDLLEEWDLRLDGYEAAAFISLHADSCENFDDGFDHSGFKLSPPVDRLSVRDQDTRLADCVRQNYAAQTGLAFAPGGITDDMTKYHAFGRIAAKTPAVILEVGLLSYDRDLLEHHTDKVALGVVNGLRCYLQPTSLQPTAPTASARVPVVPSPTAAVVPTATP